MGGGKKSRSGHYNHSASSSSLSSANRKQQQKQQQNQNNQDTFDEDLESGSSSLFGLDFSKFTWKEIAFCIVISTIVSSILGPFIQLRLLQYRLNSHLASSHGNPQHQRQYPIVDHNAKRVTTYDNMISTVDNVIIDDNNNMFINSNPNDVFGDVGGSQNIVHANSDVGENNINSNDSGDGRYNHQIHQYYDPSTQGLYNNIGLTKTAQQIVKPTLCSDGINIGYSDWVSLELAIREANAFSAEKFLRHMHTPNVGGMVDDMIGGDNSYVDIHYDDDIYHEDDSLYYEYETVISICPGAVLNSRGRGSIYVNAENIIIECGDSSILDEYVFNYDTSNYYRSGICTFDNRDTHLSFGPHAKNVLIKGMTFQGIQHSSSLTFYHDGADVVFEDCFWLNNIGNGKHGAVADVNSTSTVSFSRCDISDAKSVPLGVPNQNGNINFINNGGVNNGGNPSSLTIRNGN